MTLSHCHESRWTVHSLRPSATAISKIPCWFPVCASVLDSCIGASEKRVASVGCASRQTSSASLTLLLWRLPMWSISMHRSSESAASRACFTNSRNALSFLCFVVQCHQVTNKLIVESALWHVSCKACRAAIWKTNGTKRCSDPPDQRSSLPPFHMTFLLARARQSIILRSLLNGCSLPVWACH
jgi:hypothetical protein